MKFQKILIICTEIDQKSWYGEEKTSDFGLSTVIQSRIQNFVKRLRWSVL